MGETQFQHLSVEERRLALRKAQAEGPHPAFLLEKDIWAVATLNVLFEAPFGRHLVFKGSTSLSKVWRDGVTGLLPCMKSVEFLP